jgi:hypothetical protein
MDPGLHVKQAINHLERVLGYASFVAQGRDATVHLTYEDWNVVADMLFHMDTPREFVPAAITGYRLNGNEQLIELDTAQFDIKVAIV